MLVGISGKMGSGKNLVCTIIQGLTAAKKHNIENPSFEWIKKYYINSIWEQKAFAGKLKQIASLLTGVSIEMFEDQEFKNKELPEEWNTFYISNPKLGKLYYPFSSKKEANDFALEEVTPRGIFWRIEEQKTTPRLLLQVIGTECIRDKVHPNAWVNALFADYKPKNTISKINEKGNVIGTNISLYPNWIITDMRFPNELEAVKSRGGITIRVNRFEQISTSVRVHGIGVPHESETALDNADFDYTIENNSSIEDLIHTVSLILKREKII